LINYLSIALGSSFELETQLIIAGSLNLLNEKSKELFEKIALLQKQINAFRNSIKQ